MPSPSTTATTAELPAIPPGTRVVTLENGLTLILREDHSAPVVSAQAWCRTGSIHEDKWLGAGLSHVLEHMLFKGTTRRPAGKIDQEVQENGGYMNAYTSFDRTVYWINIPNTGAQVAIDILCDVVQNASLPPDELAKELDVIRREMDMNHDDPGRRASRRLFEVAFTRSHYRHTIIGYPDIFDRLKPDDIRGYYEARYAPNNITFVVVGDFDAEAAVAQIREAFAKTPARPLPPIYLPDEPRQTAPREYVEEAPIELGHLHMCWHVPDIRHPDIAALDVLAVVLGGGRSSRLFDQVREKLGLVHSVDAWIYSPGSSGLFGMSAVLDGPRFEVARDAMMTEVERIRHEPVSEAELAKAVKQCLTATLSARKTMQGQAQDLGASWFAAQDLSFSERLLGAIKRTTTADLLRVAQAYLTPENRTLFSLLPEGASPKSAVAIALDETHPIQKFELPNGLRLLVKEDHRLPFVQCRMVFRGGVLGETAEQNGVVHLMSRLLIKGTTNRSGEQIAREIESLGGSLDTYAGYNSHGASTEVLSQDFAAGLDLLADVVLRPSFPEAELERERELQLAAIRDQRDQVLETGGRALRRGLFGACSYGLDPLGTEESVRGLDCAPLRSMHARTMTPDNAVLAVFGDVKAADVRTLVQLAFGGWEKRAADGIATPAPAQLEGVTHIQETRDKKQAAVLLGFRGTTYENPDRHALELIQETCSDLGSRLFLRIREQLGLAYHVGASHFYGLQPGYFAFFASTAPEAASQVEAELLKEAELLRTNGLSGDELRRAKAKLIGQRKIGRQDLGSLALTTALDELYGLGFNHHETEESAINAVTETDVLEAAQRYLRPQACVVATVLPQSADPAP